MYTIHADGQVLFDSLSEDIESIVLSPKLSLDVNKPGSLSFVLPPGNAMHGQLQKLKSIVVVKQDSYVLFRGRVLEMETDFYNQQTVYCEGEKAFLRDSVYSPGGLTGKVQDFFRNLVSNHNAQVDAEKQFVIGVINAVGADVELNPESRQETRVYWNTLDMMEDSLLNVYGGYLRTRTTSSGLHMLDWVKDYGSINEQAIEFSVNLLDLSDKVDAGDVFTCLIPLGASEIGEDGEYTEPVSIASVNDGLNYIQDDDAVALYGKIWRSKTWSYIDDPAQLLERGREYLKTGVALQTITLKAIDMHFADGNVMEFWNGDRVRIRSEPHGLDQVMLCSQLEIDLLNPENTVYTFGERPRTLTENVVRAEEDVGKLSGRGGGGRSVQEEISEIIRWAQINVDETNAFIQLATGALNNANQKLTQAEINIDGLQAAILLKAEQSIVNEIERRVSSAEIEIDAANSKIALLVSNEEVGNLHQRVSTVEAELDAANARIDLITNSEEITDLAQRVTSAEIAIDGLNGKIELKASSETVQELSDYVDIRSEQIEDHEMRLIETEKRVGNAEVAIDAANARIDLKADLTITNSLSERVTNAEIDIDAANARIDLKADLTATEGLSKRVGQAEIDIDAANSRIDLKADLTVTTQLSERVNTAFAEIDAANARIDLKADSSLVEQYGSRISYAEIAIDGLRGEIELKVSKDGVISSINQTAEEITINASKINLSGYVTASKLEAEIAAINLSFANTIATDTLEANSALISFMTYGDHYCTWKSKTVQTSIPEFTKATITLANGNQVSVVTGWATAPSSHRSTMYYLSHD